MKKKLSVLILILIFTIVLTGCACEHIWAEADCVNPKTCTKCEETEGMPLGHVWMAATCETSKTCEVCAVTEGEPKGHAWVEATCTEAKHCTQCKQTEGDVPGHKWLDATTEAPQTCEVCQLTEGEKIITDPRFHTADVSNLLGKWSCELVATGEDLGMAELETNLVIHYILEFCNDGNLKMYCKVPDEAAFWDVMVEIYVEALYQEFAAQGIGREQADAAIKDTYGMGIEEYLRDALKGISINELMESIFSAIDGNGVYYVEDGQLYIGMSWNADMESQVYSLEGDNLTIDFLSEELGVDTPFVRVTE